MGDRGTVTFSRPGGPDVARVFSHGDGSRLDTLIREFFAAEQQRVYAGERDARWADPRYLAARFLVWVVLRDGDTGRGWGIVSTMSNTLEGQDWIVWCAGDPVPNIWRR